MPQTRRDILKLGAAALATGAVGSPVRAANSMPIKFKAVSLDAFAVLDPWSVSAAVEETFPGKGTALSAAWRTRQFEYTWLRTLNRRYVDFWQVTEEALIFAAKQVKVELTPDVRAKLMQAYLDLKPWPDSIPALKSMRDAGIRLAYLSNFTTDMLRISNAHAGIIDLFEHVLSTDRVEAFKPDARAYQMAEGAFHLPREQILFGAFAGWDAAGAKSFGLPTYWVNRLHAPREELGVAPDVMGDTLMDLAKLVTS